MRKSLYIVIAAVAFTGTANAQDFVYAPLNPSFGGNPLNSQHLLATANAQRSATARDAPSKDEMDSLSRVGRSDAELFLSQLQGRLLSQLAAQVTSAIFGEGGSDSGEVVFGDTQITFNRTVDFIELSIFDGISTTQIKVPQLVITGN